LQYRSGRFFFDDILERLGSQKIHYQISPLMPGGSRPDDEKFGVDYLFPQLIAEFGTSNCVARELEL
jgi:single-stranded DNA-specific DHH superfamily exonuclease